MKLYASLLAVALLTACSQNTTPADTATAEPAAAAAAGDTGTAANGATPAAGESAGTAASATGTVESVDAAGGRIVIAHGPVEALKWPAMTMGFKASPDLLQSVQPGQAVRFDFTSQGPNNTLTRIEQTQ